MAQLGESSSRSLLPERVPLSPRTEPQRVTGVGAVAGRLARVSCLAVQTQTKTQAVSWNTPQQYERPC